MTVAEKREKVIKGLEICSAGEWNSTGGRDHTDCPYYPAGYTGCTCKLLMRDALVLLKAQEPMKPVVDIDTWKCGNCGHTLEHQQLLGDNVLFHEQYNYCQECGKAVKWDG